MHLVKFFVVHCAALVFLAFPLACLSASSVERNVLIGLVNNNEPGFRAEVLTPTLDYLKKTLPNISFRTVDIAAGDSMCRAREGEFVLLDCYRPHQYGSRGEWEASWLHFDGSLAREYYQEII